MNDESTVYGYIKNTRVESDQQNYLHHSVNRQVIKNLPSLDGSSLITQEFFSIPTLLHYDESVASSIIHFGQIYKGVEYEWGLWIATFEQLLQQMYWTHVVVHLETEISGIHTFTWECSEDIHTPNDAPLNIRCEWQHELGISPCYA